MAADSAMVSHNFMQRRQASCDVRIPVDLYSALEMEALLARLTQFDTSTGVLHSPAPPAPVGEPCRVLR